MERGGDAHVNSTVMGSVVGVSVVAVGEIILRRWAWMGRWRLDILFGVWGLLDVQGPYVRVRIRELMRVETREMRITGM
jgi:hypothetical protein